MAEEKKGTCASTGPYYVVGTHMCNRLPPLIQFVSTSKEEVERYLGKIKFEPDDDLNGQQLRLEVHDGNRVNGETVLSGTVSVENTEAATASEKLQPHAGTECALYHETSVNVFYSSSGNLVRAWQALMKYAACLVHEEGSEKLICKSFIAD